MIPIPITSDNYLNHLSYYYNLTDEEILSEKNNPNGIDAQKCLEQMLERELCKSAVNNIISKLAKL